MMQPDPSLHSAVIHRAALLRRAAAPHVRASRPVVHAPASRPRSAPWDVLGFLALLVGSLGYALVHLAH